MLNKCLKIGITGSIGSGKSTVCKIFETLGVPVYYADDRAKFLMENDPEVKKKIVQLFGENAYNDENKLNRTMIAGFVFQDPVLLKKLNAIVHPAVEADSNRWFDEQSAHPYCLKEAALLIETKGHKLLDKLIVVAAPKKIRIDRVMNRDGVTKEQVEARMKNQLTQRTKKNHADYIIKNDGKASLIAQVLKLHQFFTR